MGDATHAPWSLRAPKQGRPIRIMAVPDDTVGQAVVSRLGLHSTAAPSRRCLARITDSNVLNYRSSYDIGQDSNALF